VQLSALFFFSDVLMMLRGWKDSRGSLEAVSDVGMGLARKCATFCKPSYIDIAEE
jgi:hypothetical protein